MKKLLNLRLEYSLNSMLKIVKHHFVGQKFIVRKLDKIIVLVILLTIVIFSPSKAPSIAVEDPVRLVSRQILDLPSPAPYPINFTAQNVPIEVTAESVIIRDIVSGVNMYKKNEATLLYPASTTKILTALVALDNYSLDDILTVNTVLDNGQVMGLVQGEKITVENLLYGILIHSGNDAAYALAENYPGGYDAFVQAMNIKARSLHMENSTYTNPMGYDDEGHKMTALDLAILSEEALDNKVIMKMVAIPNITISDTTHTYFHNLKNVNQLLGRIPGVAGIKTGWTEEAGENLVTLIERNNRRIIIVVLKSQNRFADTELLINWVFSNFTWQEYHYP